MLKQPIAALAVSAMILSACGATGVATVVTAAALFTPVGTGILVGTVYIADALGVLDPEPVKCAVIFAPEQKVLRVQQDCLFADGRSTLSNEVNLKGIADFLLRYPNNRYDVVIYTEEIGLSAAENLKLSKLRANAVVQELKRQGVPASRLSASGRGEFSYRNQDDQSIAPFRVYFVIRPLR